MGELGNIRKLSELEKLRVTSFKVFEECPHTWAAQYLGTTKGEDSKYSKIGTAAHKIIENFLLDLFELPKPNEDQAVYIALSDEEKNKINTKQWAIIPEEEQENLQKYLETYVTMQEEGYVLLALEHEMIITIPGFPVSIIGHMDAIFLTPGGWILINDHKTNRQYNKQKWWSEQFQQLLYACMARIMYPGKNVRFRIGYPNIPLGEDEKNYVDWETDAKDDMALTERLMRMWASAEEYELNGVWPKVVNDNCRWCPLRSHCNTYDMATSDFTRTLERRTTEWSTGEQLEFAKTCAKLVASKIAELETKLSEEIGQEGNKIRQGNNVWWLETKSKRVLDARTALRLISEQVRRVPDLGPVMTEFMDDVFSVKVTGIDKLTKSTKAFGELSKAMKLQKNSKPTLLTEPSVKFAKEVEGPTLAKLLEGTGEGEPF